MLRILIKLILTDWTKKFHFQKKLKKLNLINIQLALIL